MYLVLQGEVEGKIFDPFVVVDLHLRGVLVGLEVLDDIREPDRQAVVPGADSDVRGGRWSYILKMGRQTAAEMEGKVQKQGTSAPSVRSSRVFLSPALALSSSPTETLMERY